MSINVERLIDEFQANGWQEVDEKNLEITIIAMIRQFVNMEVKMKNARDALNPYT